jgi:O-antigen ligase
MRRVAWVLLLGFAFAIPWEYSLDIGEPIGNIARVVGVALLLAAIPAVLLAGRVRKPGALQWAALIYFLWFCSTLLWTIDPTATFARLRGTFQVMITVWLVWEFAERPQDLRDLLRAYVAGAWVLAILTLANFGSPAVEGQIRFMPEGQDPNDVARFLNLGFPMAALLLEGEPGWAGKLLAFGYLPLGFAGVLLTASRSGFVAALVALAGCGLIMARKHLHGLVAGAFALPVIAAALFLLAPRETFERIATIPLQLQGGDLNYRLNIWQAGWQAFAHAPFLGTGAGSFVSAARLAPEDTAHNTVLAIGVEGGIVALIIAAAIVAVSVHSLLQTRGQVRAALAITMLVWMVCSFTATVEQSRSTWLVLALISLAGRLAQENPEALEHCFSQADRGTAEAEAATA